MDRPFLNARISTCIGTWNVRSLYRMGYRMQRLKAFDDYRLSTCWSWLQSQLQSWLQRHWSVGNQFPTALSRLDFELGRPRSRSSRTMPPRRRANDTIKDAFYNQLQDFLAAIPWHDHLLMVSDYNAQLDGDRAGFESTIRPHGLGACTTDNGDRLCSFCATNDLCFGNTFFQHKRAHKTTWRAPGGTYENKTNFVCVRRLLRSSLLDVRCWRGADTHHQASTLAHENSVQRSVPQAFRCHSSQGSRNGQPVLIGRGTLLMSGTR